MSFLFAKLFLLHRFTKEPTAFPENFLSTVKTDFWSFSLLSLIFRGKLQGFRFVTSERKQLDNKAEQSLRDGRKATSAKILNWF